MDTLTNPNEELTSAVIDRFWATIPPVWHAVRGRLRATATENFSISVEQFHILRHIRKGYHSTRELAEVKQISPSAVSQAVDVLVEMGLIERHPSTQDRRCIRLELTRSGNELLDATWQKSRAWMATKLAALKPADLKAMMRGMEILGETFADE